VNSQSPEFLQRFEREWAVAPQRPLADVRRLMFGVDHSEGVAFEGSGIVWNGGELGQIYRSAIDAQEPTQVAVVPGHPLGIAVDGAGNAFVCCVQPAGVFRVSRDGEVVRVAGESDGLVIPNYGAFLDDGAFVFSDSGTLGEDDGRIFVADADGVRVIDTTARHFPNGLAVAPDGRTIYVVESALPGVSELVLERGPRLTNRRVVTELRGTVPEGIAIDAEGRLLVSCWTPDAIYIVEEGVSTLLFADPYRQFLITPTNLAFQPGARRVVCANFGHTFLSDFDHASVGLDLRRPISSWRPFASESHRKVSAQHG
jgi:gluconolactonase